MESLFDVLGKDIGVVEIVDWAVAHYKRTKRPPKVAVNADSWWYTNLSKQKVQKIRDTSGVHVNLAEINVLFFTLRMLHLGIQLHFVFDGPNLLHNGGKKYWGYDRPSLLLRESLTKLAIPWHESPGEAEADCANMENLGLVDAVWSENGDALAYGSQSIIRSYREIRLTTAKDRENKSFKSFKIFDVQEIAKSKPGMDRDGFILNALLTGGENGPIPGFLPKDVLRAARNGLQRSLKAASGSQPEFQKWVDTELKSYLKDVHIDLETIQEFPTWEQLQDYLNPKVSTLETLSSITPALELWEREEEIFKFLEENYQWNIMHWAQWIVPLRVVRSLLATRDGEEDQHDRLRLECDLRNKPKFGKATFVLAAATSLDISAIGKDTFDVETLVWIIRKARRNGSMSVTTYFTPQKSRQSTGGVVSENAASSSTTRPRPFHISVGGSSQVPSSRRTRRVTPPSPTPMRPRQPISSQMGARTTKNISRAGPAEKEAAAEKGKGRATDHPAAPPPENPRKRTRLSTPEDDSEDPVSKKVKAAVIDLTSSSSESEAAEAASMTPRSSGEWGPDITSQDLKAAIPIFFDDARRSTIVLDDSDTENDYGSFPSSPDLKPLLS